MAFREKMLEYAEEQYPVYREIALQIHAKPETSNHEYFACGVLSEQLKKEGFEVKVDVAGHPTGFTGVYKSAKPGPVLVFLAEYDALTGLGHGCGHNLFGATSLLAAAVVEVYMFLSLKVDMAVLFVKAGIGERRHLCFNISHRLQS